MQESQLRPDYRDSLDQLRSVISILYLLCRHDECMSAMPNGPVVDQIRSRKRAVVHNRRTCTSHLCQIPFEQEPGTTTSSRPHYSVGIIYSGRYTVGNLLYTVGHLLYTVGNLLYTVGNIPWVTYYIPWAIYCGELIIYCGRYTVGNLLYTVGDISWGTYYIPWAIYLG